MAGNEEFKTQKQAIAWADLKESKQRNRVLYAQVIGIETKEIGNNREEVLKLDYEGFEGYLPKTLIDDYEFKGLQSFVGSMLEFVVNYVDMEAHIFGADRTKALEVLASKFWRNAKEGKSYEAFVRGVDPYNVYVLVEGVPAKMYRDDFSYTFFENLQEVVSIGDILEVQLTEIEKPSDSNKEGRISVSKKALETDPWDFISHYKEKGTYLGLIQKVHMDHGLFIDLPHGIRVRTNFPPNTDHRLLQEGEKVNLKIQSIDTNKREIKGIVITPRQGAYQAKRTRTRGIYNGR
ncbi:30S ribosomal protein S1 (plasmid) [Rossellomorea sp. AcN35-11]|nr:30S ribosomal protein S1 [Rossellomorea aquimaris]WJV32256.1 30S ribosomal protein S1 [Rossellomorea sp. AcN35-11]